MQVKKFEAKTMKEALAMVKTELGPEAIILSAKDNSGGFGLLSQNSVEITAAVSEQTLKKRQLAMSKLKPDQHDNFKNSSARAQKKFIGSVLERMSEEQTRRQRAVTRTNYVDIADDEPMGDSRPLEAPCPNRQLVQNRYHNSPVHTQEALPVKAPVTRRTSQPTGIDTISLQNHLEEVASLKSEISRLKKTVSSFQKVPQTFISVHPGAEKGISFEFSAIYEKLHKEGVGDTEILSLIEQSKRELPVEQQRNKNLVDAFIAKRILQSTKVVEDPFAGRVHVFVGSSGQGKTSSLVKFASQLVVEKRKSVAILTADTFKIGAADQLKIFAQILNVPFAVVRNQGDWAYLLEELKRYDYLLLDFPSFSLGGIDEINMACKLLPPSDVERSIHFVIAATAKMGVAFELGRRYKSIGIQDVIFTGIDQAVHHGLIYNFQKQLSLPIHSFGLGAKIPEDFELASRERVLDLLFKLTKINKERGE